MNLLIYSENKYKNNTYSSKSTFPQAIIDILP